MMTMTMKRRMPPWVLPLGTIVVMVAVLMLSLYTQRPPGLVLLDAASGEWRDAAMASNCVSNIFFLAKNPK